MLLVLLLPLASALKFDLHPVSQHDAAKYERCVRNFVAKEQLVVVTAILDGYRGDGQRVDMHVRRRSPDICDRSEAHDFEIARKDS
jgi:hypothetical protein